MSVTATKARPEPTTPADTLAAAEESLTAADADMAAAAEATATTRQAVAAAEAGLVDAIAEGAATGTLKAARDRLDTARRDAEWATIEQQAAEVRYSRQADATAAARRAVVRTEYLAAHAGYNAADNREALLLAQLTATVAELARIVPERQAHHDTLAREVASWPVDERPVLPGRPILTHGHIGLGRWEVDLPNAELAEAIKSGLAAAAEQPRGN